jgi:hypothetical protein
MEPARSFAVGSRSPESAPEPAASGPEILPVAPALAWSARARVGAGPEPAISPVDGPRQPEDAGGRAPREEALLATLPQRDGRAGPALKAFVEVADGLRSFVAKEVREVRETVAGVAAVRRETAPEAGLEPTDDLVRKLLSRMRTLMQEERFRSGKIR